MKEENENWYNWGWLWMTIIAGLSLGLYTQYQELKTLRVPTQIKPVDCLTYKQWRTLSEKRDRTIDRLQYARKSQRKQLYDSLHKFNNLLGIDETLDNPPER